MTRHPGSVFLPGWIFIAFFRPRIYNRQKIGKGAFL